MRTITLVPIVLKLLIYSIYGKHKTKQIIETMIRCRKEDVPEK